VRRRTRLRTRSQHSKRNARETCCVLMANCAVHIVPSEGTGRTVQNGWRHGGVPAACITYAWAVASERLRLPADWQQAFLFGGAFCGAAVAAAAQPPRRRERARAACRLRGAAGEVCCAPRVPAATLSTYSFAMLSAWTAVHFFTYKRRVYGDGTNWTFVSSQHCSSGVTL